MTKLRQAAWTAIHKINRSTGFDEKSDTLLMEAASVLREALAEQAEQEPVKLEHITDGSPCWCNPEMTYKDPINGAEVLVHKELQMTKEEIIEACKNSLNIYSFTAEALEKLIEAVRVEAPVRTKDLTDEELDALWHGNTEGGWRGLFRAVIAADREKNK